MYRAAAGPRFTLLLLEEGEDYVADFNAFCAAPGVLWRPEADQTAGLRAPAPRRVHGKLRLCTKSLFFDSDDASVPILRCAPAFVRRDNLPAPPLRSRGARPPRRLPFTKMVSCGATSPKALEIQATFYTTCKPNGRDLPYTHKALAEAARVAVELEFEGSMQALMPQLMRVLEISRVPNFAERGDLLQARPSPPPARVLQGLGKP